MPSKFEYAQLKAGELVSSPIPTREKVLVSVVASHPVKVRVLGAMEEGDQFYPLSVQPGPPDSEIDLADGIVLFSVAYMQGVAEMKFELTDAKALKEDVEFKAFLRTFPND